MVWTGLRDVRLYSDRYGATVTFAVAGGSRHVLVTVQHERALDALEAALYALNEELPEWVSKLAALMEREAAAHPTGSPARSTIETFRACMLEAAKGGAHG
jgi:hypothetical protein